MNKADLVESLAGRLSLAKTQASEAFDIIFEEIKKAVASGDKVNIPGFGIFDKRDRSARSGRNPQTGAVIDIKASQVPGFKASQNFKDLISKPKKAK